MLTKIKQYFCKSQRALFIPKADRSLKSLNQWNRKAKYGNVASIILGVMAIASVITLIVAAMGFFLLFIPFLLWLGWKLVMAYFWANGPQHLINPDFWYFLVAYYIIATLLGGGFKISITNR